MNQIMQNINYQTIMIRATSVRLQYTKMQFELTELATHPILVVRALWVQEVPTGVLVEDGHWVVHLDVEVLQDIGQLFSLGWYHCPYRHHEHQLITAITDIMNTNSSLPLQTSWTHQLITAPTDILNTNSSLPLQTYSTPTHHCPYRHTQHQLIIAPTDILNTNSSLPLQTYSTPTHHCPSDIMNTNSSLPLQTSWTSTHHCPYRHHEHQLITTPTDCH